MLGRLRYIYIGTKSVRQDAEKIYEKLKTEPRWWFEAFNTEVLSTGLGADAQVEILLAEHRNGKPPIFIFQVDDLDAYQGESFGFPTGEAKMLLELATIELAVFQESRPGASDQSYQDKTNDRRRHLKP
jgi:hypothetical protein